MELILEYLEEQKRIYSDFDDIINGVNDILYNEAVDDDV